MKYYLWYSDPSSSPCRWRDRRAKEEITYDPQIITCASELVSHEVCLFLPQLCE